MIKKTCIQSV